MTLYLLLFANTYTYVFLKALQQLNVVHRKYRWVLPASFGMAACEVFAIVSVAHTASAGLVLPIGLGGGLGSLSAMWLHARFFRN